MQETAQLVYFYFANIPASSQEPCEILVYDQSVYQFFWNLDQDPKGLEGLFHVLSTIRSVTVTYPQSYKGNFMIDATLRIAASQISQKMQFDLTKDGNFILFQKTDDNAISVTQRKDSNWKYVTISK